MTERRDLTTQECHALLCAGVAGRVGLSTPNGPHVVPVNYSVIDESIIIRTSPYSLLGTYGRDTTVAFEIDGFEPAHERGWSVQARGRAEAVTDPGDLARIRQLAEPQPWAGSARPLYLRVRWVELSGRQLGDPWSPLADLQTGSGS